MFPAGRLTDTHSKYCRLYSVADGKPCKSLSTRVARVIQLFIFFMLITVCRVDFRGKILASEKSVGRIRQLPWPDMGNDQNKGSKCGK